MGWKELADYLQTVAPKKQSDLFLQKHLSAEESLKAGEGIVSQILDVFLALLPTYDATVGK